MLMASSEDAAGLCPFAYVAGNQLLTLPSEYGFCGKSDGHCLPANGCQNGCAGTAPPATAVLPTQPQPTTPTTGGAAPRNDGRCGKEFGGSTCDAKGAFGGCCSEYG